jgi:transposase-like protein
MKAEQFESLLASVADMTEAQLDELAAAVEQRRARTKALRLLEASRDLRRCIHCSSPVLVKNGHSQGLQRYRCRACLKTFNAASGTPLARLRHKERFYQQGECLAQGLTVREAAAEMDVAVSTAFRLRHRFLTAVVPHQPLHAAGLLEVDETYFAESLKGSRHLPRKARARGKSQATKKMPGSAEQQTSRDDKPFVPVLVGQVRGTHVVADHVLTEMNTAQATNALSTVVGPDTLLCIDGSSALRGAASELGVVAKSIAVTYDGRVLEGVYHVQTVNNYHARLKAWINGRLRGVATKYMPNYLAWMRMWEWFRDGVKPEHFIISGLCHQLFNT